MVVNLVSTVRLESVVVKQSDKVLEYLPGDHERWFLLSFSLLLLWLVVILFGFSQDLQSQTRVELSELEGQQSHESTFKVVDIRFDVQFVILVIQRFYHDA